MCPAAPPQKKKDFSASGVYGLGFKPSDCLFVRLALPRELIRHDDTVRLVWDGGQKFPFALLNRMADLASRNPHSSTGTE